MTICWIAVLTLSLMSVQTTWQSLPILVARTISSPREEVVESSGHHPLVQVQVQEQEDLVEDPKQMRNCTVSNVGLGRWTYEHLPSPRNSGVQFREAKVNTAQWTPLDCILPRDALTWTPKGVHECTFSKNISNVVIMGGSTSTYILTDFRYWLEGNTKRRANFHSKDRQGANNVSGLDLQPYRLKSAKPLDDSWQNFLQTEKYFQNTLVLVNSGLWDMRANDLEQYKLDVEQLAQNMSEYAKACPTNRVIWRASGTPSWERLDLKMNKARARERLLNPDNVFTYNTVAARAMRKYGIEIYGDTLIVLGRPEETRGEEDGLHPSTLLNLEIVKILLTVICAEDGHD